MWLTFGSQIHSSPVLQHEELVIENPLEEQLEAAGRA
jgi:hypothetical protein